MVGLAITLVIAAAFQVISCQGPPPPPFPPNVPEQCRRPPEGVDKPYDCCKIPPFFPEADFEECGFKKLEDEPAPKPRGLPDDENQTNSTGNPRQGHDHKRHRAGRKCTKQMCMLKKHNLLKDGDVIDHDAVKAYVDKWSADNPDFKPGMEIAKERCIDKELPGPPQICEANKIVFCISSTLFSECPAWETTEVCQKLKAHLDECVPHFKH